MDNGDEIVYRFDLNTTEVEVLRHFAPLSYDTLDEFVKDSVVFLGLNLLDVPRHAFLQKVIPSYLNKVADYVGNSGDWSAVRVPTRLMNDRIGLA